MLKLTPTYAEVMQLARRHSIAASESDPTRQFVNEISRLADGIPDDNEFLELIAELMSAEIITQDQGYQYVISRHRELKIMEPMKTAEKLQSVAERIETALASDDVETGLGEVAGLVREIQGILEGVEHLRDDDQWKDILQFGDALTENAQAFLKVCERAERGDPEAALAVLDKVPSVPPELGDEMPEGFEDQHEEQGEK